MAKIINTIEPSAFCNDGNVKPTKKLQVHPARDPRAIPEDRGLASKSS